MNFLIALVILNFLILGLDICFLLIGETPRREERDFMPDPVRGRPLTLERIGARK